MTNKPMLSVEREVIQRIADHCKFWVNHPYLEAIADVEVELRSLLDKPVFESQYAGMNQQQAQAVSDGVDEILHGKPAAQHQGEPVVVVMPEHTMRSVMDATQQARGFPVLTSNQCHALAESLNYVARLNGVKT